MEQRIGRLDRFGVGTPVKSIVLEAEGDPLTTAWIDYLDRGYRAFDRSVAALQYLTENELVALHPAILTEGAAAVIRAADRIGGPEGAVETALRDIQILDELDAVEAPPGHEHFAEKLAQADHMRRADWLAASQTWICEMLNFARRSEGGSALRIPRNFSWCGSNCGHSCASTLARLSITTKATRTARGTHNFVNGPFGKPFRSSAIDTNAWRTMMPPWLPRRRPFRFRPAC